MAVNLSPKVIGDQLFWADILIERPLFAAFIQLI